jgi:hypothetical protein
MEIACTVRYDDDDQQGRIKEFGKGGFNTWKVMIIVTDRGAASAECAPPRNFFYIKVPICDFLASKMVKVKPATVGNWVFFCE